MSDLIWVARIPAGLEDGDEITVEADADAVILTVRNLDDGDDDRCIALSTPEQRDTFAQAYAAASRIAERGADGE